MNEIIDINSLFGPLPSASADLTVETLLELLQKHQVGKACALSTLGILLDPIVGNAVTRATCVEYPELIPVATINPLRFFGDASPILKLLSEGFRMIRFFPDLQRWPIVFTPFAEVIRILHEISLPIMVDVSSPGDITNLSSVMEEYPGAVALSGVSITTLAEAVSTLRKQQNWFLETSRLLAPGAIRAAADNIGADRILFGTRAPELPVASSLRALEFAGLSEKYQEQIVSSNAVNFLSLS